jgi:hypothetical protein
MEQHLYLLSYNLTPLFFLFRQLVGYHVSNGKYSSFILLRRVDRILYILPHVLRGFQTKQQRWSWRPFALYVIKKWRDENGFRIRHLSKVDFQTIKFKVHSQKKNTCHMFSFIKVNFYSDIKGGTYSYLDIRKPRWHLCLRKQNFGLRIIRSQREAFRMSLNTS